MRHVVALGHIAFITGRQDQELAALALVGAGVAKVGNVMKPVIVDDAEDVRRRLDHHGLVAQFKPHRHVDAHRVRRQPQRLRIHQVFEHQDGRIRRPEAEHPLTHTGHGRDLDAAQIGLHAALEVQVVIDLPSGFLVGHAVEEVQGADTGLQSCPESRSPAGSRWSSSFWEALLGNVCTQFCSKPFGGFGEK
jgi:hypothetical protein